jgi:glycosyltransferase involved in cell wall biosynthesis
VVVAGNEYLARRAAAAGARRVVVLPTVIDVTRYAPEACPSSGFAIGWMGTPVTQRYLAPIARAIADVCAEGGSRVILVGATADAAVPACQVEIRPWSEESEAADVADFDVGVMPLADTEWEQGKCGYKLIQYMACAKPVVASAVGANRQIVEHGVNGFLATTDDEWRAALRRLRDDPALRERMGKAGRRRVEDQYSLAVAAPRLAELLRAAAGPNR